MTLKEALNILGLKEKCTEEDLKKAYRTLAKVYHPDNYQDETKKVEASKKMKILNEANEVVKTNIQQKDNIKSSNNSLETLKQTILEELKEERWYISKIDEKDKTFNIYRNRFINLNSNTHTKIFYAQSENELKWLYDEYKEDHFKLMVYYSYKLWEITKILDFVNGNMEITKKTTLEELRDKMLDIINKIFELELAKYKNITDYKEIEPILLGIKSGSNLICLWGYDNINNIKMNFNQTITKEIKKYHERKKLLDELIEYDGIILPYSIELYHNILNEKEFYKIYNTIKKPTIKDKITKKLSGFKNKLKTL